MPNEPNENRDLSPRERAIHGIYRERRFFPRRSKSPAKVVRKIIELQGVIPMFASPEGSSGVLGKIRGGLRVRPLYATSPAHTCLISSGN